MADNPNEDTQLQPDLIVTPEQVVENILSKAENQRAITKYIMETCQFNGKTLNEWGSILNTNIPNNCTPDELRHIYISFLNKLQTCNALYSKAQATLTLLEQGSDARRSEIVAALVDRFEEKQAKRPAAAVLGQIADTYIDTSSNKIVAKITRDFFRDQRDTLIECRKILEQLGFLMHLELKLRDL